MKQLTLEEIKQKALPILKEAGVIHSSIFGSYVRGEQKEDSDIDILVDLPKGRSLLDLVDLKFRLEEALSRKVDINTFNALYPPIRELISKQVQQIL